MATTYSDVIGTSDLPDALRVIYSNELQMTAQANLLYEQFVDSKLEFASKRGQQVYWTIYRQLPPAIGTLTENTDVDGGQLQDFQVNFTVDEYGYSIGTTEKLNFESYHGPIENITRTLLGPQMALTSDILARNAYIGTGATYRTYAGTATARGDVASSGYLDETIVRKAAHNLSIRRVPLMGNGYVCLCHPSNIYDLRNSTYWKDANLYASSVNIFNGEVGMLHGVRFIECHNARLPNAGAVTATTTLNDAACTAGELTFTVTDSTGFAAGQEITIVPSGHVPDGTHAAEEHVIISSIDGNVITLRQKMQLDHANSSVVREARDIFPLVFLGSEKAVGKGVILPPEVRVALPTDKLRRMSFVGWYGILGFGVIRDWAMDVWEVAASQSSAYPYGW